MKEACLRVTDWTQKEKETVKVRTERYERESEKKATDRTYLTYQLYHVTDRVLMCVLQTSEYSEQMCLNETGCQPPQEESKTIFFPSIRHHRLNQFFVVLLLTMFVWSNSQNV